MKTAKLIPSDVGEYLRYDPLTGHISNSAGKRIGWRHNKGYLCVDWRGKKWLAHRLAWFLHTGEQIAPDVMIDHINHNRADNRWANLRLATSQQNVACSYGRVRELPKGVGKHKGRFRARVGSNGGKYLGTFDTPEEASLAYRSAFNELYGSEWNASLTA